MTSFRFWMLLPSIPYARLFVLTSRSVCVCAGGGGGEGYWVRACICATGVCMPDHTPMYICGIQDDAKVDFWDNVYGFKVRDLCW